jgi:hypothetical protein
MTVAQDNTSAGATNTPAEISAVSVPGLNSLSVTGAEGNGKAVSIIGLSSTLGVMLIPTELAPYNEDQAAEADVRDGVSYAEGTLTGTLETLIKGPVKLLKIPTGIKVIKI